MNSSFFKECAMRKDGHPAAFGVSCTISKKVLTTTDQAKSLKKLGQASFPSLYRKINPLFFKEFINQKACSHPKAMHMAQNWSAKYACIYYRLITL